MPPDWETLGDPRHDSKRSCGTQHFRQACFPLFAPRPERQDAVQRWARFAGGACRDAREQSFPAREDLGRGSQSIWTIPQTHLQKARIIPALGGWRCAEGTLRSNQSTIVVRPRPRRRVRSHLAFTCLLASPPSSLRPALLSTTSPSERAEHAGR